MKRNLLILLISLLGMMSGFSQTIYPKLTRDSLIVITPTQLKQTNLIFLEHNKFSQEVPLLRSQILNLEDLVKKVEAADSLKASQLSLCLDKISKDKSTIEDLNLTLEKSKSKNRKLVKWTIGGFSISTGLLILFILK